MIEFIKDARFQMDKCCYESGFPTLDGDIYFIPKRVIEKYYEACNIINYLTTKNKKLAELLIHVKCPNCDGSGVIQHECYPAQYVTREMALDAGQPELEGSQYSPSGVNIEQCQWCAEKEQILKDSEE